MVQWSTQSGDIAYGESFEARLRDKEYPLSGSLVYAWGSCYELLAWRFCCWLQGAISSPSWTTYKLCYGEGKISIWLISSEHAHQIALIGFIPLLRKLGGYLQQLMFGQSWWYVSMCWVYFSMIIGSYLNLGIFHKMSDEMILNFCFFILKFIYLIIVLVVVFSISYFLWVLLLYYDVELQELYLFLGLNMFLFLIYILHLFSNNFFFAFTPHIWKKLF